MKQSLQLKLGQSLSMTPQLQQAIKLLQMHSLELQMEIQQMLESNPMLERDEDAVDEDYLDAPQDLNADKLPEIADNTSSTADTTTEIISSTDDLPVDAMQEDRWESFAGTPSGQGFDGEREIWETLEAQTAPSLQEHLLEQLQTTPLSASDSYIAHYIINALNDQGFLCEDVELIRITVAQQFEDIETDEVLAVLHRIQQLDPLGVAARSVEECLKLQLSALPAETEGLSLAHTIIEKHMDWLAIHDYARLKRALRVNDNALAQAVSLIQSLNPNPTANIQSSRTDYIVPDVFVKRHNGQWVVELNPDLAPKLHVNKLYASLAQRGDKSADGQYMRDNLQEARWFIKSLLSRNDTILRTAQAIVKRQRGFFDYGDEAMKPMVLRDIADDIEMHESTISRVTTQKYMHTPRGIFELKHFFSSHVSTADGGECSATAIRAMIKKLISEEDSRKPLSDNKLATILDQQGINVARRTVAKYREAMNIPPSNERKRLA